MTVEILGIRDIFTCNIIGIINQNHGKRLPVKESGPDILHLLPMNEHFSLYQRPQIIKDISYAKDKPLCFVFNCKTIRSIILGVDSYL